jgi:RNA polymerase-binding transcription factor DksA
MAIVSFRSLERLDRVNRALKKIVEGSYGVAEVSGNPIRD